MENLSEHVAALEHQIQTLHHQVYTVKRQLGWWRWLAWGLLVLAALTWALPSGTAQEEVPTGGQRRLAQRVATLEQLFKHFSRKGNEVFITGANLHIVNGLGRTDCGTEDAPMLDCPNGLGNLIVGYNELRGDGDIRSGSHNVVVGQQHNFSHMGGLVVGSFNTISGNFASVSAGTHNAASGNFASVSGGQFNAASGDVATVSGGAGNTASGNIAAVSGGGGNTASGDVATVSGGQFNTASMEHSSVSGGALNTARGASATVSGGRNRTAKRLFDWVAGSLFEDQ